MIQIKDRYRVMKVLELDIFKSWYWLIKNLVHSYTCVYIIYMYEEFIITMICNARSCYMMIQVNKQVLPAHVLYYYSWIFKNEIYVVIHRNLKWWVFETRLYRVLVYWHICTCSIIALSMNFIFFILNLSNITYLSNPLYEHDAGASNYMLKLELKIIQCTFSGTNEHWLSMWTLYW